MTAIAIAAFGAISALGEGAEAIGAAAAGTRARVAIAQDEELARAGLARPFAARVSLGRGDDDAYALLARALTACVAELDQRRPRWRSERVGMILGTSSGAMRAAVRMFDDLDRGDPVDATDPRIEAATYYGPVAQAVRDLGLAMDPCVVVLGACASSSLALGLGARWLDRGTCDLVLAGGFDAVTVFVAAGFEALRATTATPPPRPFRQGRDGMSLGDGAAVLALARAGARSPHSFLRGFGASSDAVHLTAPDREGRGLARAASAALAEAGHPQIDLVSAHATATPFNDAAESRALALALGRGPAGDVVVHAFKAQIGHTLGAGGALELLAGVDALDRGLLPASAGAGDSDADAPARLLERSEAGAPAAALKLTSAFGGANAALVVGQASPAAASRPRGSAWLHGGIYLEQPLSAEALAARTRLSLERIARGDGLVLLALSAVAELEAQVGSLEGAGIIVGSALATVETNALFAAHLRDRGALAAPPRRFPYTSPNAAAGEGSIAFALTGPSFAVGGGMHAALEALACAAVLVESGDAPRMVVVAADEGGPVTKALVGTSLSTGAVAFLLTSTNAPSLAGPPRARVGAVTLARGVPSGAPPAAPATSPGGHRALVPLALSFKGGGDADAVPADAIGHFPPDVSARVGFVR